MLSTSWRERTPARKAEVLSTPNDCERATLSEQNHMRNGREDGAHFGEEFVHLTAHAVLVLT